MTTTKGHAIALAVVACLIIGSGIGVMVVFKFFFDAIAKIALGGIPTGVIDAFWPFGVPVLVCGVLGIIAAIARNNIAIGFFMALCIVSLVVEAGLFIIAILLIVALSVLTVHCYEVAGICVCSYAVSAGVVCNNYEDLVGLGRACTALIIVAWILLLAGSIVSCVACCGGESRQSGGMVLQSQPQTAVFTTNQVHPQYGQGGYGPPPGQAGSAPPEQGGYSTQPQGGGQPAEYKA